MHDPSILLLDIPVIRLDVWHDEPGGHDAGEVCGYPPSTRRTIPRVVWAVRHVRHLHYRWWPYLKVRRWLVDRCADCGQRFRWKDSRHGYQSSDKVWHDVCMSLRHTRSQLDDITAYVRAEADSDARWRVEYRLQHLDATQSARVDR